MPISVKQFENCILFLALCCVTNNHILQPNGHRLLVNLASFPLKSGTGKLFCLTLFNPSAATSCVLPFCLVSKTRVSGKIHAQTGGCQGALTVAVAVSDTRHTRSGCPQSEERMLCCLESLFRGWGRERDADSLSLLAAAWNLLPIGASAGSESTNSLLQGPAVSSSCIQLLLLWNNWVMLLCTSEFAGFKFKICLWYHKGVKFTGKDVLI